MNEVLIETLKHCGVFGVLAALGILASYVVVFIYRQYKLAFQIFIVSWFVALIAGAANMFFFMRFLRNVACLMRYPTPSEVAIYLTKLGAGPIFLTAALSFPMVVLIGKDPERYGRKDTFKFIAIFPVVILDLLFISQFLNPNLAIVILG